LILSFICSDAFVSAFLVQCRMMQGYGWYLALESPENLTGYTVIRSRCEPCTCL